MFIVRAIQNDDLDEIYELSLLASFINLPSDKNILKRKIESSVRSFTSPSQKLADNFYIFVLEDTTNKRIAGTSMIHAQHGTEHEPHYYLRVSQENKFSKSLNTGFIHGTLKLGHETNGPTEIGGLVIHPDYRNNPNKLGKLISFSRFLYIGMHPERFRPEVHAELMPPFDSNGNSPLWEAIGRRFLNMNYQDADILSRENKEFILSLFPSDTIYVTLLPTEARNAIGKVGPETHAVKAMLEKVGFKYTNEVDPFDGGPHYRCKLKDIRPIKEMIKGEIKVVPFIEPSVASNIMISLPHPCFATAKVTAHVKKSGGKTDIYIASNEAEMLSLS